LHFLFAVRQDGTITMLIVVTAPQILARETNILQGTT
jgi:hypothetical protein